jgi:sRNA-binding carbon storage regulator CsrA
MPLKLNRSEGQKVIVTVDDKLIEIEVRDIRGGRASLLFTAPPEVKIDREEVHIARRDQAKRINHDRPAPSQGSAGNPGGL